LDIPMSAKVRQSTNFSRKHFTEYTIRFLLMRKEVEMVCLFMFVTTFLVLFCGPKSLSSVWFCLACKCSDFVKAVVKC
jgi:hypothetical protein